MLIKNVRLNNEKSSTDLRITNGKFAKIAQNITPTADEKSLTVTGTSYCHHLSTHIFI